MTAADHNSFRGRFNEGRLTSQIFFNLRITRSLTQCQMEKIKIKRKILRYMAFITACSISTVSFIIAVCLPSLPLPLFDKGWFFSSSCNVKNVDFLNLRPIFNVCRLSYVMPIANSLAQMNKTPTHHPSLTVLRSE